MPCAYAHLTIVNKLKATNRLDAIPGLPTAAKAAVSKYLRYCELGAVSPDYPYLALGDKRAAEWADTMHWTRTGEVIHAGVRRVRAMNGESQKKVLAWLLGYVAHVTADVTIHPVVNLKVGDYEHHKTEHRICEMHQDVYIYQQLNLGGVHLSEHLDDGICQCGTDGKLDADICAVWDGMLQDVHPNLHGTNKPDFHKWHRGFVNIVDNIAQEGESLMPVARHIAAGQGLVYPALKDLNREYIDNLEVPGGRASYDEIFEKAINNVAQVWALVGGGVVEAKEQYLAKIGNWNLDTGKDASQKLVFWS